MPVLRQPSSPKRVEVAPGAGGEQGGAHLLVLCERRLLVCCGRVAAGVANLLWMATLTALMVYEKTGRARHRAVPIAGVALLAWAAAVLTQPASLPAFLTGAL
ncbi:MAG: DUF2182 domain-containing protein [Actinomycetes bacterium]